jgi:hypothetical protein
MREIMGIVVLVGCGQQLGSDKPIIAVTPSNQRATSDIVPQFFADGSGSELNLDIQLFDRLEQDQDPQPAIELSANEHLYAVVGQTRVRLIGELYPVPGFGAPSILWQRYTATIPAAPEVAIEFARADGSVVTSTIDAPAAFVISSPPPPDMRMGDQVTFAISPAPDSQSWARWDAWCDATPDQLISSSGYDVVEVAADGEATTQLGVADYGYATDCAAQLQVMVYAYGHYDPAFATTYVAPLARQQAQVGVHLWGI